MKKLGLDGKLNEEIIEQIMLEEKPNQKEKFTMPYDQLKNICQKGILINK